MENSQLTQDFIIMYVERLTPDLRVDMAVVTFIKYSYSVFQLSVCVVFIIEL